MYAIIETGGKQYKVTEGEVIYVELLGVEEGTYTFDHVLAVSDENGLKVGSPYVEGAVVEADVHRTVKGKKLYVFKYKSKKNEKKKIGHRQPYSEVQISKIKA